MGLTGNGNLRTRKTKSRETNLTIFSSLSLSLSLSWCVFRPVNACAIENHEKSTFSIMHTRGSCKAHEEKQWKKFVGQRLGVTTKSWLTPKSWLLIWNLHEPYMVFYCFQPLWTHAPACICWPKYTTLSLSLSHSLCLSLFFSLYLSLYQIHSK